MQFDFLAIFLCSKIEFLAIFHAVNLVFGQFLCSEFDFFAIFKQWILFFGHPYAVNFNFWPSLCSEFDFLAIFNAVQCIWFFGNFFISELDFL